jgi:hypothetical protein
MSFFGDLWDWAKRNKAAAIIILILGIIAGLLSLGILAVATLFIVRAIARKKVKKVMKDIPDVAKKVFEILQYNKQLGAIIHSIIMFPLFPIDPEIKEEEKGVLYFNLQDIMDAFNVTNIRLIKAGINKFKKEDIKKVNEYIKKNKAKLPITEGIKAELDALDEEKDKGKSWIIFNFLKLLDVYIATGQYLYILLYAKGGMLEKINASAYDLSMVSKDKWAEEREMLYYGKPSMPSIRYTLVEAIIALELTKDYNENTDKLSKLIKEDDEEEKKKTGKKKWDEWFIDNKFWKSMIERENRRKMKELYETHIRAVRALANVFVDNSWENKQTKMKIYITTIKKAEGIVGKTKALLGVPLRKYMKESVTKPLTKEELKDMKALHDKQDRQKAIYIKLAREFKIPMSDKEALEAALKKAEEGEKKKAGTRKRRTKKRKLIRKRKTKTRRKKKKK